MTDCGSRSTVEGAQLINWSYFEGTGLPSRPRTTRPDRECAGNSDERVNMAARGVMNALMKQPEGVRVCAVPDA